MTSTKLLIGLFVIGLSAGCGGGGSGGEGAGGNEEGGAGNEGAGNEGAGNEGAGNEGAGNEGAGSEGGSGEGGAPPVGDTLDIAGIEDAVAGCATFVDGVWSTSTTEFTDGEPDNMDCALVPIDAGDGLYWITSRDFEGTLGDNDLRHAYSTSEAPIEVGSAPLELLDYDTLEIVYTGVLTVSSVDGSTVTIQVE